MLKRLIVIASTVAAAILFAQPASAAPPGASHVYGSGSTVWGVWGVGSQSFSRNVCTTPHGLGGAVPGTVAASVSVGWPVNLFVDPPVGEPRGAPCGRCGLAGHYRAGQVVPFQGVVVIVQNDGAVQHAWAVLLEAESLASAQSECNGLLGELGGFGPLPVLKGQVTIC